MSKSKIVNLSPLQRRILLLFAEEGPQTINEVKEKLGASYKSILSSFKSLEKKGLIKIVPQKPSRAMHSGNIRN